MVLVTALKRLIHFRSDSIEQVVFFSEKELAQLCKTYSCACCPGKQACDLWWS
jgi:hypothetical protein